MKETPQNIALHHMRSHPPLFTGIAGMDEQQNEEMVRREL